MARFVTASAALLMLAQTPAQAQAIAGLLAPVATRPAAVLPMGGGVPVSALSQAAPATQGGASPADPVPTLPGTAAAAAPVPLQESLLLDAGAGRVIAIDAPVASLFAADPKIAEVRPASPTSMFVFGVAPGRTTIAALDGAGRPIAEYQVTVRPSAFGAMEAQQAIYRSLPGRGVEVRQTLDGLVLMGAVANAGEAERAVAIARGYLLPGQKLDNRLTVLSGIQVNLRVRVAEMDRSITREFGVNWQALGNIGKYSVNFLTNNSLATAVGSAGTLGASYVNTGANVNGIIDALAQDNLVHVLAEPNLTTMSGQPASFLVGGEFPIPIAQSLGTVSIQFQQFGISLSFVPTVLSSGRIDLHVRPEVSQLTNQGAVQLSAGNSSIAVPALTIRRADTTVELGSGQSFAIAGLLQDSLTQTDSGLPWLGEVPILGALFRSQSFQRNQTELVIVVTPYIVHPVSDPADMHFPTEGWGVPNDVERILLLRQRPQLPGSAPIRIPGEAGFVLQ